MLGLLAAMLWGLHDFTVRRISAVADPAALYLVVLGFGSIVLIPLSYGSGGPGELALATVGFSALAGLVYALGVYALYRAFAIGPVRLVAPICGAYPLLSIGIAIGQGQPATALVWLAALAVLGGIGVVAQGEGGADKGSRRTAIGWSVLAASGFAVSFAMLHSAAQSMAHGHVALIARLAGFAAMLVWVLTQGINVKPALTLWPTLLLMGLLDVGGMIAVTAAGSYTRPEFAAVSSSCFGLVTILLAWRFLKEKLTKAQWMGAAMVFGGIIVLGLA